MSVKFNGHCGQDVRLSDDGCTAENTGCLLGHGIVLSGRSLSPGEPFMIQIQATYSGGRVALCLGVTSRDPDTRPELPVSACKMKDSWCVGGPNTYQDGEETGRWGGELQMSPGHTAGVVWDGQAVSIIMNGTTTQVFTNVPGPVWALTDMWFGGVRRMSVVRPDPKIVDAKTKSVSGEKPATVTPKRGSSTIVEPPKPLPRLNRGAPKLSGPTRGEPPTPTREPAKSTKKEGLAASMNEMSLEGPPTQSMGACGVTPRRTSSITCPYWQVCDRFIDSLGLPDIYFDSTYDHCYCTDCVLAQGENLYYSRGVPAKLYGLPLGWCRLGLSVPVRAHGMQTFELWHVAYHGTIARNIQTIIESENLLMPGDYTIDGKLLAPPSGHFTETRKPAGFDINQVFVSPTIAYAGHPVYARPQKWTDPKSGRVYDIQVALQVRIKPDAYQVGKETLGLGRNKIDSKFNNSELEWSTKIRGATILQGILVKILLK